MKAKQATKAISSDLSRRNFLLALGAGGAATATALALKASGPVPSAASPGKQAKRGYRVSEHISNYYRTTSV